MDEDIKPCSLDQDDPIESDDSDHEFDVAAAAGETVETAVADESAAASAPTQEVNLSTDAMDVDTAAAPTQVVDAEPAVGAVDDKTNETTDQPAIISEKTVETAATSDVAMSAKSDRPQKSYVEYKEYGQLDVDRLPIKTVRKICKQTNNSVPICDSILILISKLFKTLLAYRFILFEILSSLLHYFFKK